MIYLENFESFSINETSATGGPFVGGGMGYPSAAPGLAGQTIGTNWSSVKSTEPDEVSIPYNPSGANRVFQKVPTRKSRFHRSTRDKKRRPGIKDILFKKRQDFTAGQGGEKPSKVMSFQNFYKDDITSVKKDEGLATTIGSIGLAASSLLNPKDNPCVFNYHDTTIQTQSVDKSKMINEVFNNVVDKYPDIIVENSNTGFKLPISVLEMELNSYNNNFNVPKLSLKDLDLIEKSQLNLKINYFYTRGLDIDNKPFLMPILNLSYTKSIKIYGHDIYFNFTRINGIDTFGAKINF